MTPYSEMVLKRMYREHNNYVQMVSKILTAQIAQKAARFAVTVAGISCNDFSAEIKTSILL